MKKRSALIALPFCVLLLFVAACGSNATVSGNQITAQQAGAKHPAIVKAHSSGSNCFNRDGELASHADQGRTAANASTYPGGMQYYSWKTGDSPWFGADFHSCDDANRWLNDVIYLREADNFDFFQVRWSAPGSGGEQQFSFDANREGKFAFYDVEWDTYYTFKMQGCTSHWYGGSSCSDWSPTVNVPTYEPGYCHYGYVWRGALGNDDHACVPSADRAQAALDNSQAARRVDPNGGYGPDTCIQGYVWRGIGDRDHVCVTPAVHNQAVYDEAHSYENTYH